MQGSVPSVDAFMQQYHMQCPMAFNRLVQVGLPATIEHRKRCVVCPPGRQLRVGSVCLGLRDGAVAGSKLRCRLAFLCTQLSVYKEIVSTRNCQNTSRHSS